MKIYLLILPNFSHIYGMNGSYADILTLNLPNDWQAIVLGILCGILALSATEMVSAFKLLPNENSRKLLHILACFSLIAVYLTGLGFGSSILLAGLWLLLLLALRFTPTGSFFYISSLRKVKRVTFGEVYLIASLPIMIGLDLSVFAFIGSYLVLAFADTAAALFGKRYGGSLQLPGLYAKTIEGSSAFFVVAVITLASTCVWQGYPFTFRLLVSFAFLALFLTVVELFSFRGLDNITVPLLCALYLKFLFEA